MKTPQQYITSKEDKYDKYITVKDWDPYDLDEVHPFVRSIFYNNKGLIQMHPRINNIFINDDNQVQIED